MASTEICPICGEALEPGRTTRLGGWKICSHHWVRIMPSKYASRCHECMGQIIPGEEILLSKDNHDAHWVALHRRDRCEGAVRLVDNAPAGPWAVLYLIPGAPPEVVKAAYRALAQRYHPDKGGDTAKMQEINAALAKLVK